MFFPIFAASVKLNHNLVSEQRVLVQIIKNPLRRQAENSLSEDPPERNACSQGDQMSLSANGPKCGPNTFFVKINA
jgi:hypothetical protein